MTDQDIQFERIKKVVYELFQVLGCNQGILAPIGSWGDCQPDDVVAECLEVELASINASMERAKTSSEVQCCLMPCTRPAEFEIYPQPETPDGVDYACRRHAGELLPDGWAHIRPLEPFTSGK